jgi:hypothetical protein
VQRTGKADSRGKGTKIIALADDHSLPLAVSIESASPHESQLVEGVLGQSFHEAVYSYRNATMGSTLVARRAGMKHASNATESRTAVTAISVSGAPG